MSKAGALDDRITIERATITPDAFNNPVETWAALATVAAGKTDLSDREVLAAQQVGASMQSRFLIRSSVLTRDVTAKDRLSYGGAIWNIAGIKEVGGRNRFLEITAARRADT